MAREWHDRGFESNHQTWVRIFVSSFNFMIMFIFDKFDITERQKDFDNLVPKSTLDNTKMGYVFFLNVLIKETYNLFNTCPCLVFVLLNSPYFIILDRLSDTNKRFTGICN